MDDKEDRVNIDGRIEEVEAELARIEAFLDTLDDPKSGAAEYIRDMRDKRNAQLRSLKNRRENSCGQSN